MMVQMTYSRRRLEAVEHAALSLVVARRFVRWVRAEGIVRMSLRLVEVCC